MPRKKVVAPVPVPPTPVAPPHLPPSSTLRASLYEIHQGLRKRLDTLLVKYGASIDHLETRHFEAFDRVLDATSANEAEMLAKKAEDKIFVTLLALTSAGKIVAKTPEAYRKRADKAESMANYLYSQYIEMLPTTEKETAQRGKLLLRYNGQLARARNLRDYAKRLDGEPNLPPFEELYGVKEVEADVKDEELTAAVAHPLVGGPGEPVRPRSRRKTSETDNTVRVQAAPHRVPVDAKVTMRRVRGALAAKKRGRHSKDEGSARPRRPRHQGR